MEEASTLSTTTFRDLGILPETAEALEAVGITTPFPIQEMTLPVALAGNDVIGQAKTGTGKTLGFGLPLLERVTVAADVEAGRARPEELADGAPQALVVVPTRELCVQVTNDLLTAGKVRDVRVLAIYGGRAYEPQVEALNKGVDVVVGTPGRLLDLAGQRKLALGSVRALVLDEADEMLDLGFLPDVEKIMEMLPRKRQTMLFSATMPGQVISLARRYMSQPTHIRATAPDDEGATVANITQHVFRAHSLDKVEMVSRILQARGRGLAMIFARTKRTAADVADQLSRRGFAAGAVHGDLGQGAREQALRAFRNGKVDVLVCTDVAARGIDVDGVTHVVNYQCPEDEKTYLHRVGRTGRAGASGTAITLVDWDDVPRWQLINKALDLSFNEPEETYSTSGHLYELLDIPTDVTGVLPRAERTRAGLAAEEIEDLGETGGRGPRGRRRGDAEPEAERPRRERTPRRRRRTRGGQTSDAPAEQPAAVAEGGDSAAPEAPEGRRTPRRRRRTRSGASAPVALAPVDSAPVDSAPVAAVAEPVEVPVAVTVLEPAAEAPAKPARRRTRAVKAVAEPEAAPETASEVTAPVTETVPAPRKRTTTRKAAAVAAEPTEAPEAEAAPAPRKRTTRKAVADAPEAEATPAPRKRATRKAVAEAPEAEAAPAPRKRTTRKAVAEAPEAEAAPAPRKRTTRKAVADAPEAEATPAPRKRTTRKTVAEALEAQATPAPRKRATRKAVAEAPEAEAAPAPRKRTTRKAVAAEPAEADAAPAPRKRTTRKTAAKAVVAEEAVAG
ncbi:MULTISPECIES: DEAD/DEAH box helicase [Streptomycetaceae]|uniref:DEAD/DEAH box helicase n=1 Tax=Streptomycetaceae TaxID=2062 RepID=UPI000214009F|nr:MULTISPECIES: DEAD/DEAH box helicase [Streptomycetaceae]MYS60891.1 DEAD/DEAH box helicase [Streptomyces sp. SID5468]CCB76718.1 conserved protein of unknown function [Streptantibioticus cattleyicolor NRRL 8057 = DSM 46488]